jgi:hypothetical protein
MPSGQQTQSSLIYNAINLSTHVSKRDYRYERRESMRTVSKRERLLKCGKVPHGSVTLNRKGNYVIQSGLVTCCSVWCCPVCSCNILTHRSHEVEGAISAWTKQGGYFIFETLTLCHRSGDTVAKQRSGLKAGWDAINGGSFSNNHKKAGQAGYLRVIEPTYGKHGFHIHIHVLRFMSGELSDLALEEWMNKTFDKWRMGVASAGLPYPSPKGHDYRRVLDSSKIGGYMTKGFDNPVSSVANAVTTSHWNLLTKAIAEPKSSFAHQWQRWEVESAGMRQMTWSRNIRTSLGLDKELEDEEIAEQRVPILEIDPNDVSTYGHLGRIQSVIRHHLEKGELAAVLAILEEHGIGYRQFDSEPT